MKETIEEKLLRYNLEAKNRIQALVENSWPDQTQIQQMNPFCGEAVPAKPVIPLVKPQPQPTIDLELLRKELQKQVTKAVRNYIADMCEKVSDSTVALRNDAVAKVENSQDNRDCHGDSIIYPNNCKFIKISNEDKGCIVIEDTPCLRTILGPHIPGTNDVGGKQKYFRIPFPYVVYIIKFSKRNDFHYHNLAVAFGTKPIQSINSYLLNPTLPHMRGVSDICMPVPRDLTRSDNLQTLCNNVITHFWNTKFWYRFDEWGAEFQLKDSSWIRSFDDWEKHGVLDILEAQFCRGPKLSEILDQFATTNYGGSIVRHVTNALNSSAQNVQKIITENTDELNNLIQNVLNDSLKKINS